VLKKKKTVKINKTNNIN